jgi:hypothetical protein
LKCLCFKRIVENQGYITIGTDAFGTDATG